MDVAILLYDGFDELDAVGPFEVFQNAGRVGGGFSADLVTLEPQELVTASHGMRVAPDGTLPGAGAPDRPDLLVIPGGGWSDRSEQGAWAEYDRGTIPETIAAYHDAGATVAAVCTGGMLLAKAGVLDGRPAVTHASAMADLRETAADVREARVVDDGDLLTAGGVTSGIDLALQVVRREAGADVADRVAEIIEYDTRQDVLTA